MATLLMPCCALLRLAERCFNVSKETDSTYGATVSSPLTFLRIIHQINPLFRGGGKNYFLEKCNVMSSCTLVRKWSAKIWFH